MDSAIEFARIIKKLSDLSKDKLQVMLVQLGLSPFLKEYCMMKGLDYDQVLAEADIGYSSFSEKEFVEELIKEYRKKRTASRIQ